MLVSLLELYYYDNTEVACADNGDIMAILIAIVAMMATQADNLDRILVTSSGCLPLEQGDDGSPVISARVDDSGPFAFVLDTGSSGTTLDDRRIAQLRLVPDGPAEQAEGMGGAIDVRLYRLRRFQAGPIVVRDMIVPGIAAPSLRSHDIAGLAGIDVFGRHLATWRWDQSCVWIDRARRRQVSDGKRSGRAG